MSLTIDYGGESFRRDLLAGLTVAAISLPQAMAYALLAGVDPRYGLNSAILVTAVASVFGSSSHLINGPTSAISLVVFSALAIFDPDQRTEAAEAMFLIGAMVGSIQILIAVFRLGDLTRYISESVILGFMGAAALLLGLGQISNALGVRDKGTGAQHVLHRLWLTLTQGDAINVKALARGDGALRHRVRSRRRHPHRRRAFDPSLSCRGPRSSRRSSSSSTPTRWFASERPPIRPTPASFFMIFRASYSSARRPNSSGLSRK
jgi:hypothetical protein